LLAILVIAQVDFVIGSIMGPVDDEEKAKGFVGYSGSTYFFLRTSKDYVDPVWIENI